MSVARCCLLHLGLRSVCLCAVSGVTAVVVSVDAVVGVVDVGVVLVAVDVVVLVDVVIVVVLARKRNLQNEHRALDNDYVQSGLCV